MHAVKETSETIIETIAATGCSTRSLVPTAVVDTDAMYVLFASGRKPEGDVP